MCGVEGGDKARGHGGPGFQLGDALSQPRDLGRRGAQLRVFCLEHARTEAGMTQQQLATAAGVHRMTVASIEGGNTPKPATATNLVAALAQHGVDDVDPATVHQGRLRSDPDAAAALYQLGRLLAYLPLRSPKDEFWTVLGEHLGLPAHRATRPAHRHLQHHRR